eukprot:361986-Chlamydomonas_euryale.AAC.2
MKGLANKRPRQPDASNLPYWMPPALPAEPKHSSAAGHWCCVRPAAWGYTQDAGNCPWRLYTGRNKLSGAAAATTLAGSRPRQRPRARSQEVISFEHRRVRLLGVRCRRELGDLVVGEPQRRRQLLPLGVVCVAAAERLQTAVGRLGNAMIDSHAVGCMLAFCEQSRWGEGRSGMYAMKAPKDPKVQEEVGLRPMARGV